MKEGSGQLRERGSRNSLAGHSDKAVVTGVVAWNAIAKKEEGTWENHPSCDWAGKRVWGTVQTRALWLWLWQCQRAMANIPSHVKLPCVASQIVGNLSLERSLLYQNRRIWLILVYWFARSFQ